MKGDFTRFTFRPGRHYDGVRMQQGRVQVDADFNEEGEIRAYLEQTEATDVIGRAGAPATGGGFQIAATADGVGLTISAGRIYVDGILCENEAPWVAVTARSETAGTITVSSLSADGYGFVAPGLVELLDGNTAAGTAQITHIDATSRTLTIAGPSVAPFLQNATDPRARFAATYANQPSWPEPPSLDPPTAARTDLVYLDVWQRHVGAVEDPGLLDEALGGVDTSSRVQTVWQVRVLENVTAASCSDPIAGWPPPASGGRLTNEVVPGSAADGPCVVPSEGGYSGIENRLYRVEVHEGSDSGAPTFKWSRDNGSVAFSVAEFVDGGGPTNQLRLRRLGRDGALGLQKDDWVEMLDDGVELAGQPGQLAQVQDVDERQRIVTLSQTISGLSVDRHARLRRWDDANGARAIDTTQSLSLENGIEIRFAGDGFRPGDYWVFAARTASGTIEQLTDAPPRGIVHHYCRLALATWKSTGAGWQIVDPPADCRIQFPPLTDICAVDVCYDNSSCKLTDVETVQDALDRLCQEYDLSFHKRRLHGWGIVCGLQVNCAGDASQNVLVREGYAIDCDGRDVILDGDETVGMLDALTGTVGEAGNAVLADGLWSLILGLQGDHGHTFSVEPYEPAKSFRDEILKGTLLWDIWNDCIVSLVDFFKTEFDTTPDPSSPELVSPAQKRLTTALNLLIQLWNPDGQYVFLSAKEDAILREFYARLRAKLSSPTFCAMFAGARPFPDYPFGDQPSTMFGKEPHTRLRIDPTGSRAYTCGSGNMIDVYDLGRGELVEELIFPDVTVDVADVAFSPDGKSVYAIAQLGNDTRFASATYDGTSHTWSSSMTICDEALTTLATTRALPDQAFAVAPDGTALYSIPLATADKTTAVWTLPGGAKTAGQLVVATQTDGTASAFLTGGTAGGGVYDTVYQVAIEAAGASEQATYPLIDPSGAALTGSDDVAVAVDTERGFFKLAVVANTPGGKCVLLADVVREGGETAFSGAVRGLDDTDTRLLYDGGTGYLLVSLSERFRVDAADLDKAALLPGAAGDPYRQPVQIAPIALASTASADPASDVVYALNAASKTVTTLPARSVPSSPEFDVQALVDYRDGVLAAIFDLFGGFVQYLKDCACEHLLVDCGTCDGSEKLYLAEIEIRNGAVYHVCNFSKRRYVKSFPAVEYWLSAVPVLPLVHYLIETICCAVLPERFSKIDPATTRAGARNPVTGAAIVTLMRRLQPWNAKRVRQTATERLNVERTNVAAWAGAKTLGVHRTELQRIPLPTPERIAVTAAAPTTAPSSAGAQPAAGAEPSTLRHELDALRGELEKLRESQRKSLASRDRKIADLSRQVEQLAGGGPG